jgi:hypothetical protein
MIVPRRKKYKYNCSTGNCIDGFIVGLIKIEHAAGYLPIMLVLSIEMPLQMPPPQRQADIKYVNSEMKPIASLALSIILLLLIGSCQERKRSFSIPEGHVGMFGYGSLMSRNFIDSGLLGKHYAGPFLAAHLNGYKRSWTFAWPSTIPFPNADGNYYKDYILIDRDTIYPENLLYLNIKEDSASIINGVLYIVPKADLPTYDGWELGYERIEVTRLISDFTIEGGPVFAYKALPDFVIEPDSDYKRNIIELSYAKIIRDAFNYWGKEFEAEFRKSTEPIDSAIIRENQKAPWLDPPLDKMKKLKSSFKYTSR